VSDRKSEWVVLAVAAGMVGIITLGVFCLHRLSCEPAPTLPSNALGFSPVPGGRIYRVPGEGICFVPMKEEK
jgi:hypothetical protein